MRKYDGKGAAAIAVAAIAFSQVYPVADWHPADVGKILDIGRHLDRTSALRNKTGEMRLVRPHELIASFYIDFTKLTTRVGAQRTRVEFSDAAATAAQAVRSSQAADDAAGCILQYDRQRYVAVWTSTTAADACYYVFYVCGNDDVITGRTFTTTRPQRVAETCCLRIHTAETFGRFVPRLLRPQRPVFHLVAVRILSVQEVSKYPEENPQTYVQRQWSGRTVVAAADDDDDNDDDKSAVSRTARDVGAGDVETTKHDADLMMASPYLLDFQQAFAALESPPGAEILRGFNYVEQNVRIPCMNVAAVVMLRLARSFTWTWDTLEEVLALGHQIYEQTRPLVDGPDVMATDVARLPIRLGRYHCGFSCFISRTK